MKYVEMNEAINADGLRIVIVKAMPSAWGVAAKGMIDYKSLDYVVAHQMPMTDNPELLAWSGTNSGPVVAWNNEPPINRWNDIIFLLERLDRNHPLLPENAADRIKVLGICHEICGELGFGWNRRLDLVRTPAGEEPNPFGLKYGYNDADAAAANQRVVSFMQELTSILKSQQAAGSNFLVGNSVTAADFHWAAFSNFVVIQPHEECPMNPDARPMFQNTPKEILDAVDPILLEHRDRIMREYYKLPLEL